ncbi:MAG: IS5 family transposase [Hyphomicrobiaceae bacterium]|nr:IS5 family transposase [Hyphomicrobiaceae bacterium]
MSQLSFASLDYAAKKKRTKREVFLAEMEQVVPWSRLEAVIAPHYPKASPNGGRRPFPLGVMLRIYLLQQWYQLSDPGAEEALYDICSMRAFAGLELGRDAIPDETTILNFRHLLERHELTKAVFAAVAAHLEEQGALLRGGTIMDATLIAASPSTKNNGGKRDPEMSQSKKGNQWYFGMKAHIGIDARSGLVHTAGVTTGSVHDAKVMDNLIRADDRAVFGDKGYVNERKKRAARAAGVYWAVKEKPKAGRRLSSGQKKRNRRHGAIRARVEHVFRVLKCQFGYRKVRYRGIEKNGAQVFALLALANLYLARRRLAAA